MKRNWEQNTSIEKRIKKKRQTHTWRISSYFISFVVVVVVVVCFPVFRPNSSITIFTFNFASFCSLEICFSFAYPFSFPSRSLSRHYYTFSTLKFVSALRSVRNILNVRLCLANRWRGQWRGGGDSTSWPFIYITRWANVCSVVHVFIV